MRTKQLFLTLALLLTAVTGAWADNWDVVYRLTQTTSANWAALGSGSTTGWTLGSAGNTTYYYATGNLSFTNSNDDRDLHGPQCQRDHRRRCRR